ncbi:peptidylprolyl isomerase [Treponema pectinovorum]|uniref:peptidylprolyl isomerase n=1 Tax=Treponema pectinovorum TaxID=164 RepID=UPI003D8C0291
MKKTMLFVGSVIVLILSAITFIFIPAMAQGAAQDSLVFGKYGNKKIEYKQGSEFANAVANYTEMYRRQGAELRDSDYYYIYSYAFASAVQAVAYSQAVKKSGWAPAPQSVARQMFPYFSDEKGNYSSAIYNSYSEEDKNGLKNELSKSLIWNRYSEDLLGSQRTYAGSKFFGLKTPDSEIDFIAKSASAKRSLDLAIFEKSDYPDSEVKSFGESNRDKFTKYNLSVITVKDKSKAKSILNQIKKEEITFADAVSEYSDKAYSSADGLLSSNLGYQITNIITKDEDEKSIFDLKADEMSEVTETSAGFSIFRANLAKTEPDFTDKTTLDLVRTYIQENEATMVEDYFIAEAKKLIESAKTNSFVRATESNKAKYVSVPAFALNFDNSSILGSLPSQLTDISVSTNENFLKTAFSLKNGEISEPIVASGRVMVLKVTGEETLSPTDEQKSSIKTEIANMDASAAQSTLLASKKVKNNVSEVFFNKIMK